VLRALRLLVGLLPSSRGKNFLLRRLGFRVAPSARIAPCLLTGVSQLEIADDCVIGSFNIIKDLTCLSMGRGSTIGHWNWISAATLLVQPGEPAFGRLRLGEHASLTSRHYVDVSGGVDIGRHAVVAGHKSTLMTHGIDMARGRQEAKGISVGAYTIISSDCRLAPGSSVPDRCLVGMGSVIIGSLPDELTLYAGVPARHIRKLDPASAFFRKTTSFIA
jgi:acetyltransferase-like isoleucine patch superfamily enzyme